MTDALLPSRVLFVDDDRSMRVALCNASRALGIEATVAESGGEACELLQHESFAVVVTDLCMPGIDGVALIERLSSLNPATAFVVISAPEFLPGFRRLADGVIASLLMKPLEVSAFRQALASAFALHQRRRLRVAQAHVPEDCRLLFVGSPDDAVKLGEYVSGVPGLHIAHAARLQDALTLLHDQRFEAILTDLSLPDARGFDALLRLQASSPEAALLAYSDLEDEDEELALQVVQLGAQDFLPKTTTTRASLLRCLRIARERKRAELRLRRLAHYDQLTGLANRASFDGALAVAIARAERQEQHLAVMMIDLDGFKAVNDSLGHAAGDHVLQDVGVRLRCLFRDDDLVARFGGDEFAVLLTDVRSLADVSAIASRVLGVIDQPGGPLGNRVTASVGIALWPGHGRTPRQMLRAADMAMYASKRAGRSRFTYFEGTVPRSSHPAATEADPSDGSSTRLLLPRLTDAPAFPHDEYQWSELPETPARRAR